jgi:hypothetical protein
VSTGIWEPHRAQSLPWFNSLFNQPL